MIGATEICATIGNIIEHLLSILGGAVFVLLACNKWLFNIWANRIAQREQHELDEKLKNFEAILNQQNYVKKSIFDEEFAIYRELSSKLVEQIKVTGLLANAFIFRHPKNEIIEKINLCRDCFCISKCAILAGRPFIAKDIYRYFDGVIENYNTVVLLIDQKLDTSMTDDDIRTMIYEHLKSCDRSADCCLDLIGNHLLNYFQDQVQEKSQK